MPRPIAIGRRSPTNIRFSKSARPVTLTALVLSLLPVCAFASCWEISATDKAIIATDIWQIRNHSSGEFSLLGKSDDERHAVSLEQVQLLSVDTNIPTSWISGNRNAANIQVQFIDGRSVTLLSDMTLYYDVDGKRHTLPIRSIISARRCADELAPTLPDPLPTDPVVSAPVLTMKNGDTLYGKVTDGQLDWQTSYATVTFEPAEIKSITTSCDTPPTGVLQTLAGDLLNGRFVDTSLTFHLTTGQIIDVPTDRILVIAFTGESSADAAYALECSSDK